MIKHTLTQEDLDNNPSLIDEGLKVGDVIELPVSGTAKANGGDVPPVPPPHP